MKKIILALSLALSIGAQTAAVIKINTDSASYLLERYAAFKKAEFAFHDAERDVVKNYGLDKGAFACGPEFSEDFTVAVPATLCTVNRGITWGTTGHGQLLLTNQPCTLKDSVCLAQ